FERAKCLAMAGDKQNAVNELQRFAAEPLKNTAAAPMALLQLSFLLREQRRANDAANVLAQCRQQHEAALSRDPERADWNAVLQYQHGMALKEAGKLAEARSLFDQGAKQFAGRAEGVESVLRASQCQREEGMAKLEAAHKVQSTAKKPEELAAARRALDEGLRIVGEAVKYLETKNAELKQKQPSAEIRARMLYETAWGYRTLAEAEVVAVRTRMQQELLKKKQDGAVKKEHKEQ